MTDSPTPTPSPDQPKKKRPLIRRILRWGIILVVVLLIADFVLLPLGAAIYAAWPYGQGVGDPPAGFTAVDVPASDGTRLSAWYAPSQNGAAIILLPGSGGTREKLRDRAEMLAAQGFGALALDPRGAGESDGQTNRFGWAGTSDVGGAIAYLSAQPGVDAIGGWGISMGAEVLLGAIGEYPQLAAVIADGATNRSYEEKFDLESAGGPLVEFQAWMTTQFVKLLTGDEPPTPMLNSIRANDTTRLLLIAAEDTDDEIDYNELFAEAAGERAELWIVPDVGHTGGWGRYRDEYTGRVVDFFTATLLASPADPGAE